MPIVQREWRVVFRIFDDRVEVRIPAGVSRDEALEIAQRAIREDGWTKFAEEKGVVGFPVTLTRVLKV